MKVNGELIKKSKTGRSNAACGGFDMSEREYKALRSVPASTWMEGFCVTKQMEEACMCLMSGEVSVTAQSQTVSRAHRFPLSVASCQHGKRDSIGTPTEVFAAVGVALPVK